MAVEEQRPNTERLLVLDVRLPDDAPDLWYALPALVPKVVIYALSFLIIYSFWTAHRWLFGAIAHADGVLVWLNGLFLLCVAFLPVPVGIWRAQNHEYAAVVFYALSMTVTASTLSAICWYIRYRPNLLRAPLAPAVERRLAILAIAAPVVFLASIPWQASASVRRTGRGSCQSSRRLS